MRIAIAILCVALAGCRSHLRRPPPTSTSSPPPSAPLPSPSWQVIGHSVKHNPLRTITIGSGPYRIYLIGAIHGNEPEGLAAARRLAEYPSTQLSGVTLRILEDANPDGTLARSRSNSRGRDLNRNWPASNFSRTGGRAPLSELETHAAHLDIEEFNPHLILVFHSIASGPFVNFDGPAGDDARAFAAAAAKLDPRWKVVPQMGYATPGSLGSYYGRDRAIPILTIEFHRGQDSESATAAALAGIQALIERARHSAPTTLLHNHDTR